MYLVVQASKDKNGQIANMVTPKDSFDEARALFHQTMASMYVYKDQGDISYGMCTVLDYSGRSEISETIGNPDWIESGEAVDVTEG